MSVCPTLTASVEARSVGVASPDICSHLPRCVFNRVSAKTFFKWLELLETYSTGIYMCVFTGAGNK